MSVWTCSIYSFKMEYKIRKTLGYIPRNNQILTNLKCNKIDNPRPSFNTITNITAPGFITSVTCLKNTSAVKFKFINYLREGNPY